MPHKLFIRFMQLARAVDAASSLEILEPIEERVLRVIALANFKKQRLSVKDLMNNFELASPATTHKIIHSMIEKDWIELAETEDSRRKQVQLTPRAIRHFDQIGKAAKKVTNK